MLLPGELNADSDHLHFQGVVVGDSMKTSSRLWGPREKRASQGKDQESREGLCSAGLEGVYIHTYHT